MCTHIYMHTHIYAHTYRIMQIVRGRKLSRLHDLFVIRRKTFAIVQQFETPYNRKKKICWKTFAIRGLSAKTAKVFHRERFALYGIYAHTHTHIYIVQLLSLTMVKCQLINIFIIIITIR